MKISDEFTDLDLSRAMKHLLRKRKSGLCRTGGCKGIPVDGGFCRQCAIAHYQKRRAKRVPAKFYKCRAVRLMEEAE